ncbi:YrdB family protein [Xylanimonas allomyrinae]|uniref:YrdB family protein n=1 Tax=Xylanimonas allomyrinae TaxID=2509459 RepID=UPI0013A650D2|nr:YrdB family protein [Xylanimonas allomyrinae]
MRFALELALLAGVAWCAWAAARGYWWRWPALGLAPVAVGVAWGAWLSPRAPHRPAEPARVVIEVLLFGGVGGWLWWHGHPWLGVALAGTWALDRAVIERSSSRPV